MPRFQSQYRCWGTYKKKKSWILKQRTKKIIKHHMKKKIQIQTRSWSRSSNIYKKEVPSWSQSLTKRKIQAKFETKPTKEKKITSPISKRSIYKRRFPSWIGSTYKIKFQGRSSNTKEEKTKVRTRPTKKKKSKSVSEVECPIKRNLKSRPNVLD